MGGQINDLGKTYASYEGITVFLQPEGCGVVQGQAGTYPSFPQPYCWAAYPGVTNGVSHEVGHTLNLYHTDNFGFGKPCVGFAAHDTTRGDLVSDTPIDYWHSEPVVNCAWDTSQCRNRFPNPCLDSCGGFLLDVDPTIIMSNMDYDCTNHFTTGQANRIKKSVMVNTNGTLFGLSLLNDTINGKRIISTPTNFGGEIYVGSDDTLIITSTVYMPAKARIILAAGAVLHLNDGTITKNKVVDVCGERTGDPNFWRGIEMNMPSSGSYPKVYITNGTIEFSELGIHNSSRSAGNGHISVNGGTFRNNKRSINVIRAKTGVYLPMIIRKARFYIDNDFPLSNYTTQVKVDYSVITFDSCRFEKPTNKTSPVDTYAIKTFNTGVTIKNSTFKDSLYGLQASSMLSNATIGVSLTKFSKMFVGIFTNGGVNNYSVTKDTFENSWKYGLLSDQCTGYIINNNDFRRTNTYTNSVGILMSKSGTAFNYIQKNKFSYLLHGNISSNDNSGLQYLCNDNENRGTSDLFLKGLVLDKQGNDLGAAGNTSAGNDVALKLDSLGLNKITYYYKNVCGQKPQDVSNTGKLSRIITTVLDCTLKGKPNPDTVKHITIFDKLKDSMNVKKDTRTDSIDGGNTSGLLAYIAGANSGTATSLYNQLIYRSPWLSSAVALAAYNRSDIFDSTKRANILFENPDLFVSREFRQALSDADSPLAESSLLALDTLTNYASIRTDLESEIVALNLEMNALCYDKIYELKMDTVDQTDSILVWLDRADDYGSRREIAETYFANGDFSAAYDAVEDLSNLDNLTDSQISDISGLEDLLPFMEAVIDDGRYEGDLTEEEIEWLEEFVESNSNQAGAEVIAALDFYYGIQMGSEVYLKGSKKNITKYPSESVNEIKVNQIASEIVLYPNPSQNELTVILPLVKNEYWEIELKDLNGKLLQSGLSTISNYVMDISGVSNGVYLIECHNSDNQRIVKRIQIIK